MSRKEKEIYLSKQGKTHGPFTPSEFEAFVKSGEINQYSLIWDEKLDAWAPLDVPPPPKPDFQSGPNRSEKSTPSSNWSNVKVICHDTVHAVCGALERVTETGCLLVSEGSEDSPQLATKSIIVMNLLDTVRGKSMNVRATLSDVFRRDHQWIYQIRWDEAPSLN